MSEIVIPELAESITEGTIAEWLVKEGDSVDEDTPILELETDKVNLEINAEAKGVITEILKPAGTDVVVGDVIGKIGDQETAADSKKAVHEEAQEVEGQTMKNEKQQVAEEPLQQKEKSTEDCHEPKEDEGETSTISEKTHSYIRATPAARKKARELGIDLTDIKSRLQLAPLTKANLEKLHELSQEKETEKAPVEEKQEAASSQHEERVRMSRRRMTIAKRLVDVQRESAMLTTFNEIDLTEVMKLRKERKETFIEQHDVKLGFMSFFTKAVVAALKKFPRLNAEIEGNELILKKYYDIGIAVSAEEGLVVPVLRNADRLDFAGIEKEIKRLSQKSQQNTLAFEDLQGGTFTITNGGVFGSLLSTPILNAPQVGILGMHSIQKRPVAMPDDTIEIRPMMYVALSYDHRIVDGKEAVQFLVMIKQLLEDPYRLLLES